MEEVVSERVVPRTVEWPQTLRYVWTPNKPLPATLVVANEDGREGAVFDQPYGGRR